MTFSIKTFSVKARGIMDFTATQASFSRITLAIVNFRENDIHHNKLSGWATLSIMNLIVTL